MSFEAKSAMRWILVTFAVVVVVAIALVIWNVRVQKATMPPTVTVAQNKVAGAGSSSQPAPGEVSQIPKLFPGDTCEKASEVYGAPTEKDQYGLTWRRKNFTVYASTTSNCILTGIGVTVEAGYKMVTTDGITLGMSTLADAERILRSRLQEDSESVEGPEDHWDATIALGPTPTFPYKTIYLARLGSKKVDQLNRDPIFDDFRGQLVTEYSLEIAAPVQPTK